MLKASRSSGVNDAKLCNLGFSWYQKKAEFKTENRKVAEFRFKTKNIRSDNGSCLEWRVWLLDIIETRASGSLERP
jgi:hypothetical protein